MKIAPTVTALIPTVKLVRLEVARASTDPTLLALDALAHVASIAADYASSLRYQCASPELARALDEVIATAGVARAVALKTSRALPGVGPDACAYCGASVFVVYRSRPDLYLCERCYTYGGAC